MTMRILKRLVIGVLGLLALLIIAILLIANSQDGSVRILQSYLYKSVWNYPPNAYEPRQESRDELRSDGLRLRTEIRYGDQYPNSHFDLWSSNADASSKRPTIIYLHGGGWFMGDKTSGDPMANSGPGGDTDLIVNLARQGLNVVNLNYALAPEYRYPVQMIQLNDAIGFLGEHADEYGVDMDNIVVMGGSAGAHMAAQYGLIVSDPAYAADVGIRPAISASSLKALVLYVAPFQLTARTWRFNAMMWAYLGTKNLENSRQVQQTNIPARVGPHYPATYLTDGNQPDTFPEYAKEMARVLGEMRIDHIFNYYEPTQALLGHGYTSDLSTPQGRDNLDKTIAFIRQRTGLSAP
jgi:acetyl esterase